jgi:hypothetical protein
MERHQQTVHRRAHLAGTVEQDTTTLQADLRAYHARPGQLLFLR